MPRSKGRVTAFDLRGGVNRSYSPDTVDNTELRQAQNLDIRQYGGYNTRAGTKRIHTDQLEAGAVITGAYQWDAPGGKETVVLCNGHLFHKIETDATFTKVASTLSTTVRARFATYRSGANIYLYIADGTSLRRWDGAALVTSYATAPNCRDIRVYKERMYATDNTKRLYWSKRGDPTLWDAANGGGFADVETYDAEPLTGLALNGSSLLLGKEDTVARFTGSSNDDMNIDRDQEGVCAFAGVIAPLTFIELEEGAFGLSDRGPFIATESALQFVGLKIESEMDALDRGYWTKAVAAFHRGRREVWLSVPPSGASTNTRTWILNLRTLAWSGPYIFTGFAASVLARYELASGLESLIIGGYDGLVRETSTGAVDDANRDGTGGSAFDMLAEYPVVIGDAPDRLKSFPGRHSLEADLGAVGQTATIEVETELGTFTTTVTSLGAGVKSYPFVLPTAQGARPLPRVKSSAQIFVAGIDLYPATGRRI